MCYLGSSKSLAGRNCLRDGFSATYFNYAEIVKNRAAERQILSRPNSPKANVLLTFELKQELKT